MAIVQPLADEVLQDICDVFGDASDGLSGKEIAWLLNRCGMSDPEPGLMKRRRLYAAMRLRQQEDRSANNVLHFIQAAMDPKRHVQDRSLYTLRRGRLNDVLAKIGLELTAENNFRPATPRPPSEAEQRAARLRSELLKRDCHPDVLRCVRAPLMLTSCTPVIQEGARSISDKIRHKTGLSDSTPAVVKQAFGLEFGPKLVFNSLLSERERTEHRGMIYIMQGLLEAFPDALESDNLSIRAASETDALEVLSMMSYIHRRLDQVVATGK